MTGATLDVSPCHYLYAYPVILSVLSVILSASEESGGHISCTLSCPRSFTPPAAPFRMTKEWLRSG